MYLNSLLSQLDLQLPVELILNFVYNNVVLNSLLSQLDLRLPEELKEIILNFENNIVVGVCCDCGVSTDQLRRSKWRKCSYNSDIEMCCPKCLLKCICGIRFKNKRDPVTGYILI